MPPSIYRGPEAKHFALVHRSQRDPLINDAEASERVLHPVQRQNEQRKNRNKGLTRHELESSLGKDAATLRSNVGEASMYDIYYDDSEYDYMQHLKPVGLSKEAVLLDKPSTTTTKSKSKTSDQPIQLRPSSPPGPNHELELPDSVQPTPNEHMLSYQDHLQYALPSNSAIPDEGGLFPLDDDPALREVLEALEDDAYVEEDTGDEFFVTIVKDGERDASEEPEWIHEIVEQPSSSSQWESEMAKFKPPLKTPSSSQDPLETCSSTGSPSPAKRKSASRNLPPPSVRGSVAGSAFSMSSSAMFRNEGLTDLDDRFEKIEKEYESSDSDEDGSESGLSERSDMTATPGERRGRADLEAIMDDFLDRFEVLGGKMKPVLEGKTAVGKLETLRTELLGPADPAAREERLAVKEHILRTLKADQQAHDDSRTALNPKDRFTTLDLHSDLQNKWDCQTILTTYSNLENHPRVIRIKDAIGASEPRKSAADSLSTPAPLQAEGKIGIDRATGFPVVNGQVIKGNQSKHVPMEAPQEEEEEESDSDGDSSGSVRGTLKRDRNEDKEAKKARKAALKAERAARRQIKKSVKVTFAAQKNVQDKLNAKLVTQKSMDIAGSGGKGVIPLL